MGKEIRPKINELELQLLIEAMEKAGYLRVPISTDPRYRLYRRFRELQKGSHVKHRIRSPAR